ncbi:hypothetical protein FKM82_005007 [Ascaphus truei]
MWGSALILKEIFIVTQTPLTPMHCLPPPLLPAVLQAEAARPMLRRPRDPQMFPPGNAGQRQHFCAQGQCK